MDIRIFLFTELFLFSHILASFSYREKLIEWLMLCLLREDFVILTREANYVCDVQAVLCML